MGEIEDLKTQGRKDKGEQTIKGRSGKEGGKGKTPKKEKNGKNLRS